MPNVRLVLEYDGSSFHGWQRQPGLRTIQGELERVLALVLREPVDLLAAGRTDAGVHARGQVVSFHVNTSPDLVQLARSLNALLQQEIAVMQAEFAPEGFHATLSAKHKCYVYTILNRVPPPALDRHRVWHIRRPLDVLRMRDEAARLVGRHDFKSFQGPKCSAKTSERVVLASEVLDEPPLVRYRVVGEGFLKQMVRNIVGTLVAYGMGRADSSSSISDVLAARDRRRAGVTAPPQGLCLEWVEY